METTRLENQRHLFDIPENIAYFNCAYNAPQLKRSSECLMHGVLSKNHPWERTAQSFFQDAETIRVLAAEIFGGKSDNYAISPSASYGISTAARAIEPQLNSGDKILLLEAEFPSNVLAWQRLAKETQAEIITVNQPVDQNWTRSIEEAIVKGIKVISISACHWTNGVRLDLVNISNIARSIGAFLVIDATQSLGAVPLDLNSIQPDFLVAAGYKWLLCPYGFGLLYVSDSWQDARPLEETWLSRTNAENFSELVNYSESYQQGARRFDVGEKCTPTILPGVIAALEQIKAWGVEHIARYISSINLEIRNKLSELNFGLTDPLYSSPHILGAQLPANFRGNIVAQLSSRHVFISQRGPSIRFSPHLHVDQSDLDRLLLSLDEIIKP